MAAATEAPTRLKPSEIEVVKDFNPRTTMDQQKLDELAQSIKQLGLLQPLVVGEKNDKGKYPLVAGHRRLAALKKNKATAVDVKVLSVNGNAKAIAVTENLQREQVNPIDEARGFQQVMDAENIKQKDLAARLGISTSQVSDRLKLLKLPAIAQEEIARGAVPTAAAPVLEKIAKVSETASDLAATAIAYGLFNAIEEGVDKEFNCWVDLAGGMYGLRDELYLEDDPELTALVVAAKQASNNYGMGTARPAWTKADIDAARAFGCLVEHKISGSRTLVRATDRGFIASRLQEKIAKYEKAYAKRSSSSSASAQSDDTEKARRAAERERQRTERIAANAFNVELGRNLSNSLHKLDVTLERLRALCLIIAHNEPDFATGLVLTDELQSDVEQKFRKSDGAESIKVVPIPKSSVEENFVSSIVEAESTEELMAVMFEALIAQKFGRKAALSPNDQFKYSWAIPTGGYSAPVSHDPTFEIARVALDVVPEAAKQEIQTVLGDLAAIAGNEGDGDAIELREDLDEAVAVAESIDFDGVPEAAAEHADELAVDGDATGTEA